MKKIKLTWYGRCCFLIEINDRRILIDPHDSFDGVHMGIVNSDYTLISSTWHDHGHIGASPNSIIISEPGETIIDDIVVTGVETKESRGTKNVIYNINFDKYSITNFADLGDPKSLEKLSSANLKILKSTNFAFVRANQILHEPNVTAGELALRICKPQIVIPHHFYPTKFIERAKAPQKMQGYHPQVENMIEKLSYKKQQLNGYETEMMLEDYQDKTVILFSDIHPQVTYKNE